MKIRWLALLLPIRIALTLIVVFFIWQAVVFFRPRPQPLSVAELRAARAAAREASAKIRAAALAGPLRVGVAHLIGDPTDRRFPSRRARRCNVSSAMSVAR